MGPVEKHSDILQNIELAIINHFRERPKIIDYDVRDALDAAMRWCRTPDQEHAEKYHPIAERPQAVYTGI